MDVISTYEGCSAATFKFEKLKCTRYRVLYTFQGFRCLANFDGPYLSHLLTNFHDLGLVLKLSDRAITQIEHQRLVFILEMCYFDNFDFRSKKKI